MVEKKFRSWRIGTVNIRTGKKDIKLENVVHQINRARLAICGLQEVRRLGTDACVIESTTSESTNKYEVHWSGHAVKRQHGVGIAILIDDAIDIIEVTPVSARLIVLDVVVYGCSLKVINCYAPTETDTDAAKNAFYQALNKLLRGWEGRRGCQVDLL